MRLLITGVSGFLGKEFAGKLLSEGHQVTGIDIVDKIENLKLHNKFQFLKTNICDYASLDKIDWSDYDCVCHLAASGVKASNRSWPLCCQVNVQGTANLLRALLRAENYHNPVPDLFYTRTFYEEHIKQFPILSNNPYIATKAAASACVFEYLAANRSNTVRIAKLYQLFGPNDDSDNILNYTVKQLLANLPAYYGSGAGLRDWIYVEDAINAMTACLTVEAKDLIELDIGRGELVTIRLMVENLADLMGADKSLLNFDCSNDRGDSEIVDNGRNFPPNWEPKYSLIDGLKTMFDGF